MTPRNKTNARHKRYVEASLNLSSAAEVKSIWRFDIDQASFLGEITGAASIDSSSK
jgi:hypothetical protein